jgi:hypothetical protein
LSAAFNGQIDAVELPAAEAVPDRPHKVRTACHVGVFKELVLPHFFAAFALLHFCT